MEGQLRLPTDSQPVRIRAVPAGSDSHPVIAGSIPMEDRDASAKGISQRPTRYRNRQNSNALPARRTASHDRIWIRSPDSSTLWGGGASGGADHPDGMSDEMVHPEGMTALARRLVSEWSVGAAPNGDPLLRAIEYLRGAARYHDEFAAGGVAAAFRQSADLVETIIVLLQDVELQYDQAARVSTLARGTIKNQRASFRSSSRGTVRLSDLPLRPEGDLAGVRALRAGAATLVASSADPELSDDSQLDADDEWARRQLSAMAGGD